MIRALTVMGSMLVHEGPSCERTEVAGVEALVARPNGGSGPAIVFANAATPRGIDQPAVGQLLRALSVPASSRSHPSSLAFVTAR